MTRRRSCIKEHPELLRDGSCGVCWQYATNPKLGGKSTSRPASRHWFGGRPGAKLKADLSKAGFTACGSCVELANRMDNWGVSGCLARVPEIVAGVHENATRLGWTGRLASGLATFLGQAGLGDPVERFVRRSLAECAAEVRAAFNANPWRWVSSAEMVHATLHGLRPRLPGDLAAVCGVARSGMAAATVLAADLHLPLLAIDQHAGEPVALPSGNRRPPVRSGGRVLVLDDTVYSGNAMGQLRRRLVGDYLFGAVYVRPDARGAVDVYAEELPSPHLLEWNLFNSRVIVGQAANPAMRGGAAFDMDGIFCLDPTVLERDSLEAYGRWLKGALPLRLPRRVRVPLVVTARRECWRDETLAWLARMGVAVDELVMHPALTPRARDDDDIAAWKAGVLGRSTCSLYVESHPGQAERIARLACLPVACPESGRVYH